MLSLDESELDWDSSDEHLDGIVDNFFFNVGLGFYTFSLSYSITGHKISIRSGTNKPLPLFLFLLGSSDAFVFECFFKM